MGIHLITGRPGAGKTSILRAMLFDLARRIDVETDKNGGVTMLGYDFLTTPKLFDAMKEAAEPPKWWPWKAKYRRDCRDLFTEDKADESKATIDEFETMQELINWRPRVHRRGIILADEFHLIYNNREWEDTPMGMTAWVSQHRHYRLDVLAGLQDQSRTDKNLRVLDPRFYHAEKGLLFPRRTVWLREYRFDLDSTTGEMINEKALKRFFLISPCKMKDEELQFGRIDLLIAFWKWAFTAGDTYASVKPPEDRKSKKLGRSADPQAGPPPRSETPKFPFV